MLPILEKSGLKAGEDFFLAYSPEREDPGNPNFTAGTIPKVVGGYEKKQYRTGDSFLCKPLLLLFQLIHVKLPRHAKF